MRNAINYPERTYKEVYILNHVVSLEIQMDLT